MTRNVNGNGVAALAKFGAPDLDEEAEFAYPDIWQRETYPDWSRLAIGARDGEMPLILDLCDGMKGPFGILYVLIVSRIDSEPGRYQSLDPLGHLALRDILTTYRDFFEQDGRHDLWVVSLAGEGQFVFDHHNVVYAYGDLDRYEAALPWRGFAEGELIMPVPHRHNYHWQFDGDEAALLREVIWRRFYLEPEDDR